LNVRIFHSLQHNNPYKEKKKRYTTKQKERGSFSIKMIVSINQMMMLFKFSSNKLIEVKMQVPTGNKL